MSAVRAIIGQAVAPWTPGVATPTNAQRFPPRVVVSPGYLPNATFTSPNFRPVLGPNFERN